MNMIQTDRFILSESERSAIEHEMHHYEDPRAASIEALKIVQKERGWVPDGAADAIGTILGIPASDVEGVATFYSQIFRQPVGLGDGVEALPVKAGEPAAVGARPDRAGWVFVDVPHVVVR